MRWPIETCLETGKQELGMGDYEVRSWQGWHHDMTRVIVAMAFLVRVQKRLKKPLPP
jgi:SRSO17 transposase